MTLLEFIRALLQVASRPEVPDLIDQSKLTRLPPYVPGTLVYYSLDGTAAFRFQFEAQADGGIRVCILEQPPYGGRDTSSQATHRLTDGAHRYICFEPLPRTREQARQIAKAWAELTLRYVRTGARF